MAFLDDAKKGGRVALTIVEIGLDNKLSPSGVEHHCDGQVPWGQRFFASVSAIDFAPTKLVFFDGLSHVGQVSISFQDFNFGAGDYFARLFAMNPFYFNREIKIHTGYVQDGFNFANFRTRLYFIKKMDYDWESRRLKITAKDLFSKVDEKGVTFPDEKRGKLKADLPVFAGDSLASNAGYFPDEILAGNTDGYYAIDKEIILIASNVVSRGQKGTVAAEHKIDVLMRKIIVFNDRNPIDALYDILATSAGLSAHIDQNDWNYIRDNYTLGDYLNGTISNPLSIKAITKKICEQFALNIWWDDELQKWKATSYIPFSQKTLGHTYHIGHGAAISNSIKHAKFFNLEEVLAYRKSIHLFFGDLMKLCNIEATAFDTLVLPVLNLLVRGEAEITVEFVNTLMEFVPQDELEAAMKVAGKFVTTPEPQKAAAAAAACCGCLS